MKSSYVLITAARNEAAYISKTIESVINQTVLPEKWVIVNDSSTDQTVEIVSQYVEKYNFIILVHAEEDDKRNFTSKVNAIKMGFARLGNINYNFLGILDADISFGADYYEFILEQFQKNPRLGIAGGLIFDVCGERYIKSVTRLNSSVNGAIQMFRRQCYEDMGEFTPSEKGGEDALAEFIARKNGWAVRTFPSAKVFHHRRVGTYGRSIWRARFLQGERDFMIGYHPLFEVAKCMRRVVERPYFMGSLCWLSGYLGAALRKYKRTVPPDVVRYIRREQRQSLLNLFSSFVKKAGK